MSTYEVIPHHDPGWFAIRRVGEFKPIEGKYATENAARGGIWRLQRADKQRAKQCEQQESPVAEST